MKQQLSYVGINGIFAAALYFGFIAEETAAHTAEMINGAQNIAVFMAWMTAVFGIIILLAISTQEGKDKVAKGLYEKNWSPSVPYPVDLAFDIGVLVVLIYAGYIVLPIFYILSMYAGKELRDIPYNYTTDQLRKIES